MTVAIANVNTNNTFDYWRVTTNQIANAMSNIVVTTNANVATGNAIINGYFTANGLTANSITINGGVGVVNVATGNVTANLLTTNVAIITLANIVTLNVSSVAGFANLTVNNATITNGNFTNITISVGTVTGNLIANVANLATANIPSLVGVVTGTIGTLTTNTITVNNTIKIGNTASNVTIAGPNTTQQGGSYWLNGNGQWALVPGGLVIGGSNTQVQINDSGVLNAYSSFVYDKTTLTLTLTNAVSAALGTITTLNGTTINGTTANLTNIIANTITVNNTIKIGNTAANITISGPNTTQQGGTYYLNGNGSWSTVAGVSPGGGNTSIQYSNTGVFAGNSNFTYDYTSQNLSVGNTVTAKSYVVGNNSIQQVYVTTSGTGSQQIDSFLIASYRAAEYIISVSNTSSNAFQLSKILVIHNGGSVQTTEYGLMATNGVIGSFTTSINATAVSVNITPTLSTTIVNIQRTLLAN